MEKRALIMTGKMEALLYERYLVSKGYIVKLLLDEDVTNKQVLRSKALLQEMITFHPHLILCHITNYMGLTTSDIFTFFERIHAGLDSSQHPRQIIIGHHNWTPFNDLLADRRQEPIEHPLIDGYVIAPVDLNDLTTIIDRLEIELFPPKKRVLIMAGESNREVFYSLVLQRESYIVKVLPEQKRTNRNEDYLGSWLEEVVNFHPHIIICHYGYYGDMDDSFSFFERIHAGIGQKGYPRQVMIGNLGQIDTANPPFGQYRHLVDAFLEAPADINDLMNVINRFENEVFPVEKRVYIMADGETTEQRYQQLMTQRGYTTKTLQKQGFTSAGPYGTNKNQWQPSEALFKQVREWQPHIIICDVSSHDLDKPIPTYTDVFHFLAQLRQNTQPGQGPLYLIIAPFVLQHPLIDRFLLENPPLSELTQALDELELSLTDPAAYQRLTVKRDLRRVNFFHEIESWVGADLSQANFSGANLSRVNFSEADLRFSDLRESILTNAFLEGIDFRGADLRGADLRGARLKGAKLDKQTQLDEAGQFWYRAFNQGLAQQELRGRNFENVNLGGLNLQGADLRQANLFKAKARGTDFTGADLRGANLAQTSLLEAKLHGSKIDEQTQLDDEWRLVWSILNQPTTGRDLKRLSLFYPDLSQAHLVEADLAQADLTQPILTQANLRKANLAGAKLVRADLSAANLTQANLCGANLKGANLKGANLSQATYDAQTIWPQGFNPKKAKAKLVKPKPAPSPPQPLPPPTTAPSRQPIQKSDLILVTGRNKDHVNFMYKALTLVGKYKAQPLAPPFSSADHETVAAAAAMILIGSLGGGNLIGYLNDLHNQGRKPMIILCADSVYLPKHEKLIDVFIDYGSITKPNILTLLCEDINRFYDKYGVKRPQ